LLRLYRSGLAIDSLLFDMIGGYAMAIPVQVTFDCADPARVASFWAEALEYKVQDPPEGYASWPDFFDSDWRS
jgi:Glyoxalase-like domain